MIQKLEWKTEQRKISQLIPYEKNPRKLSEKQKADLKKSIEKFNLAEIPAINTDNSILAGHQRLKILKLLGRGNELIDVRIPHNLLLNWPTDYIKPFGEKATQRNYPGH